MEKWVVTPRQRCDLEMLLVGGFAPLSGFISQADYENILAQERLADGQLWPIPINLDVNEEFAQKLSLGDKISLCDFDNTLLAELTVTDKWKPVKSLEASAIYGTQDPVHPGVNHLLNQAGEWYLGGSLKFIQLPKHYDFTELRHTPHSLEKIFLESGWEKIIGFQTRNPLHRAHMELTLKAAKEINGNLLLHPVVGQTKQGDIDHFTRVRCYQKLMAYYPQKMAFLSLLPLAMRMAGPKEALWHALIRKNYGCTHFIIGRDHAGPGNSSEGKPFYDPYAAQQLTMKHQDEIGLKILPFHEMVYVKERKQYCSSNEIKSDETALNISGTQLRNALLNDQPIPEWFSFPEIIEELRSSVMPKHQQGFTLFFTGLPCSGKSTLALAVKAYLKMFSTRKVTMLDGDILRRILATELGFSKEHRDLNIRRIGFTASQVTKVGGVALCSAIAPYQKARQENRDLISQYGTYIEIYVSTPVEICEKRDVKGLYSKARNNSLKGMTGVDDPYQPPINPEIIIDTSKLSLNESVDKIIQYLCENGLLKLTQSVKQQIVEMD